MNWISLKKLCLQPFFLLGIVIRLVLIYATVPLAAISWYAPFLETSISQFSLDPWSTWINTSGSPVAFPYGYVMWLAFLPMSFAAKYLGFSFLCGYKLTLLIADFSLLLILKKLFPKRDRFLLIVYWLSPIVILATYVIGLNDLIPVLLLTLSLSFIDQKELKLAGLWFALSISAKLSMVLALPFFLIYLFNNRSLRQILPTFLTGLFLGGVLTLLPFILSSSGLLMLLSNPEIGKIYNLNIDLGANIFIYIVPLSYLLILYMVWRIRRPNHDLFNATLGIAFLLVVLMTPASPGWFIWAIPLLVYYQAKSGRIAMALTSAFSGLYALINILTIPIKLFNFDQLDLINSFNLTEQQISHVTSLLHTALFSTGLILAVRIWRETVSRNDYFRLSRKPFVIGIAGDSGAGKDTFSDALMGLFGSHSVTTLSGDDYHLWDRHKPMWQVMTHLNPMANDLESFSNDLIALTDGKTIQARHYEHKTGKMSRPIYIKSNDIIIASGLHALYLPILRDCYNLSIYLDIDEDLRRHFKLQRDVFQRGHTLEKVLASFDKREPDSARFIRPQSSHANLILSLKPIHSRLLKDHNIDKNPLSLKIVTRSRDGINQQSLTRVLVGICGLHVDMVVNNDASEIEITIEGETSAQDIELAAGIICPRIFEFLDIKPKWQNGIMGLMQLITLSHVDQALRKRLI